VPLCQVSPFILCRTKCHYAECRYAECRSAECHYAECRYAECLGAKKSTSAIVLMGRMSVSVYNILRLL
jgi:hypothetical protein